MQLLSRQQILDSNDQQFEIVEVPEWGGSVRVKGLSGTERDAYETSLYKSKGKGANQTQQMSTENMRVKLVAMVIVDENGERMFSGRDIELLGKKSASALVRVFDVGARLSRITKDDQAELEGNSEPDGSDGPSSN